MLLEPFDLMIIVDITDIHGKTARIEEISVMLRDADLVILSGDITHFGGEEDVARVVESFRRYNSRIFAVAGNCDYPGVEAWLSRQEMNLHARCVSIGQLTLVGLGGSLPTPAGSTPNEYTEDDLRFFLDEAAKCLPEDSTLLLVSHQPPINTVCDQIGGMHVGSNSVRFFIERYQPAVCFTGHIHEGGGVDKIGKTKIINPGPLHHGGYAIAEIGIDGLTQDGQVVYQV
jgi:Icc-related predicted phosphoesterase